MDHAGLEHTGLLDAGPDGGPRAAAVRRDDRGAWQASSSSRCHVAIWICPSSSGDPAHRVEHAGGSGRLDRYVVYLDSALATGGHDCADRATLYLNMSFMAR